MSEFIKFEKAEKWEKKTNLYYVRNTKNGYYIGEIKWYGAWRQYCFFPQEDTVYERKCLRAIVEFIDGLMEERKRQKKAKKDQTKIIKFDKKRYVITKSKENWEMPRGHVID